MEPETKKRKFENEESEKEKATDSIVFNQEKASSVNNLKHPEDKEGELIEDKSQSSDNMEDKNIIANGATDDENLRVFHVLNEYIYSDVELNDRVDSSESDISDNEIEAMLEEGLEKYLSNKNENEKTANGAISVQYKEHKKVTLEELGYDNFDLLPENWVQITHKSGMPLYLHKPTRVCTFSRPYYLGQATARKHAVPLSAIPCLQYKKALEEEDDRRKQVTQEANANGLRTAKIETAKENKRTQSLGPFGIQQYCKSLFRFKTTSKLRFNSWADKRKFDKAKRAEKQQQRPTFPDDTKLIKFPIQNRDDGPDAKPRGEWIMNPNGKSHICILHEYMQHAFKKYPVYEFKALENPATPYSATVSICGIRYGFGVGISKKQAKLAAARATLEILIPEMREKIQNDMKQGNKSGTGYSEEEEASLSIFDEIKIQDPRVAEFSAKAAEPLPYSILMTCLRRNYCPKDMPIEYKMNTLHKQTNEFVMTVGSHVAKVICKTKKEGKQWASQAILQDLHPHITSWGSLLRLYGNRSSQSIKEKRQEELEITMLQHKASLNSPNYAILEKLRTEMMKIHKAKEERKPIGIFITPEDVSLPTSDTQLNKIDL